MVVCWLSLSDLLVVFRRLWLDKVCIDQNNSAVDELGRRRRVLNLISVRGLPVTRELARVH